MSQKFRNDVTCTIGDRSEQESKETKSDILTGIFVCQNSQQNVSTTKQAKNEEAVPGAREVETLSLITTQAIENVELSQLHIYRFHSFS